MIKAIFSLGNITKEKIKQAINIGANSIFTGAQNLSNESVHHIKKSKLKVFIEFGIFQGEDLWQKYPDSRPIDKNGKPMDKIHWYAGVCPNNPEVRKFILTSIYRLIEVYEIDGLWLDFIRYPCHWEKIRNTDITEYCFCQICLSKFNKDVGGKPAGKKWTNWKCQQITDFVADVKKIIPKNMLLGMFAVPWQRYEYSGAIDKIIGQDFGLLSKCVDIFSPMVYQKFCNRPISWIDSTVKYFSYMTKKPILPSIQTEDREGKINATEFGEELKKAFKAPSQGTIIFFLEDLIKDKNKLRVAKKTFLSIN